MKITLYKGVELRSDYSIVLDCDEQFWRAHGKTPFAAYLDDHVALANYELDDVYWNNASGVLSLDYYTILEAVPEGINYMKVTDFALTDTYEAENLQEKYYFINSYEFQNGIIRLDYSIDIWHTFSKFMTMRNGVINKCTLGLDGKRKALPAAYETNFAYDFTPSNSDERFYLVAEYSGYALNTKAESGGETLRYNYCSLVGHYDYTLRQVKRTDNLPPRTTTTGEEEELLTYSLEEVRKVINRLTAYQGVEPVSEYQVSDYLRKGDTSAILEGYWYDVPSAFSMYHAEVSPKLATRQAILEAEDLLLQRYDLIQFYLIPKNMLSQVEYTFYTGANRPVQMFTRIMDSIKPIGKIDSIDAYDIKMHDYYFYQLNPTTNKAKGAIAITPKPTDVGVGFQSLFIPITYNGGIYNFVFEATFSAFGFGLTMNSKEGLIDITNEFAIPIPYIVPSGTDKKLAALSYQQARAQAVSSALSLTGQLVTTAVTAGTGASGMIAGASAKAAGNAIAHRAVNQAVATGEVSMAMNKVQQASNLWSQSRSHYKEAGNNMLKATGGSFTIGAIASHLITQMHALNSPVAIGAPTTGAGMPLNNAASGFGVYSIVPYNAKEIEYITERTGYDVFIPDVTDIHHNVGAEALTAAMFEPIQFATVWIGGNMTSDIKELLEGILLDGTIVGYSADVFEVL